MGNIDCVATRATGATVEPLCIQVVKALVNPELWRTLATSGTLAKPDVAVEELTDLMADALQKKLDPSKIPPTQRPGLVLVLDATRLPALAFDSVVNIFRERHRVMLETAGFREIWIAGPIESLTKRLDTA
jgi:hypothetical protein